MTYYMRRVGRWNLRAHCARSAQPKNLRVSYTDCIPNDKLIQLLQMSPTWVEVDAEETVVEEEVNETLPAVVMLVIILVVTVVADSEGFVRAAQQPLHVS